MKKDKSLTDSGLTRRRFLTTGAGALVAAGCMTKAGSAMPSFVRDRTRVSM